MIAPTSPTPAWLRLLDEQASAQDLDDERRRLAALVEDEADAAALEQDVARAGRVRGRLEERQRHAEELQVLNDLARRLAGLRESGEVLQEVANQARRLLGVDVAYIMLRQPSGLLRIDYLDGTMGTVMRGIEIEPGRGLGGQVLATGDPLWSRSYLEDDRFPHEATLDRAASSEQLGGILGVPLLLGSEVIGVLLAADRRPRVFRGEEVSLLAAMASHSSVAINNARLFEANRDALDDLRRVNASLAHDNLVRRRVNELRERLTATMARGGGTADVASDMAAATGQPVSVYDAAGDRVGGPHAATLVEVLEADDLGRLVGGNDTAAVRRYAGRDGTAVLVAPARLPDGHAGAMVATAPDPDDDTLARLLAVGGTTLAVVVSSERLLAEAELRSRGELLDSLLSPTSDGPGVTRRARSLGLDLARVRCVAVLDSGGDELPPTARLGRRLAADVGGWSSQHRGHVVVLVPDLGLEHVEDRLRRLAPDGPAGAVGLARCDGGAEAVREAHGEASQTAGVLLSLGRRGTVAPAHALGVYRMLFSGAGRDEAARFVERTVGPLLAYDADKRRDLAHTVRTYLDLAQHHSRTCQALHVHANTLYQRLERAADLLGADWREPERALDVQLALRLDALAQEVRGGNAPDPG